MVERRAEVFARMSALKEEAGILTEVFADKVGHAVYLMCLCSCALNFRTMVTARESLSGIKT